MRCYNPAGSRSQALDFYAKMRTDDMDGVTIPSQRRFVLYFEQAEARHCFRPPKSNSSQKRCLGCCGGVVSYQQHGPLGTYGMSMAANRAFTTAPSKYPTIHPPAHVTKTLKTMGYP